MEKKYCIETIWRQAFTPIVSFPVMDILTLDFICLCILGAYLTQISANVSTI